MAHPAQYTGRERGKGRDGEREGGREGKEEGWGDGRDGSCARFASQPLDGREFPTIQYSKGLLHGRQQAVRQVLL